MKTSWEYMGRELEWATREDDMISSFQQVGSDGWELVAVVPISPATPDVHLAYFKRPKATLQEAPHVDADEDAGPRFRRL